ASRSSRALLISSASVLAAEPDALQRYECFGIPHCRRPIVSVQSPIALFPLNTVLFPGGPLRLRIFEARYLDMVARCLREDQEFGVAMIVEGGEVGPARTALIGTTARVCDFDRSSDGLLNVLARGARRFKIRQVAT